MKVANIIDVAKLAVGGVFARFRKVLVTGILLTPKLGVLERL